MLSHVPNNIHLRIYELDLSTGPAVITLDQAFSAVLTDSSRRVRYSRHGFGVVGKPRDASRDGSRDPSDGVLNCLPNLAEHEHARACKSVRRDVTSSNRTKPSGDDEGKDVPSHPSLTRTSCRHTHIYIYICMILYYVYIYICISMIIYYI